MCQIEELDTEIMEASLSKDRTQVAVRNYSRINTWRRRIDADASDAAKYLNLLSRGGLIFSMVLLRLLQLEIAIVQFLKYTGRIQIFRATFTKKVAVNSISR